jgi:hypothetical protein
LAPFDAHGPVPYLSDGYERRVEQENHISDLTRSAAHSELKAKAREKRTDVARLLLRQRHCGRVTLAEILLWARLPMPQPKRCAHCGQIMRERRPK